MRACLFTGVGAEPGPWGRAERGAALSGWGLAGGWRSEPPVRPAGRAETLALSDSRLAAVRGRGAVGGQFRESAALAIRMEQTRLVAQGVEFDLLIAGQNAPVYRSELVVRRIASSEPKN